MVPVMGKSALTWASASSIRVRGLWHKKSQPAPHSFQGASGWLVLSLASYDEEPVTLHATTIGIYRPWVHLSMRNKDSGPSDCNPLKSCNTIAPDG